MHAFAVDAEAQILNESMEKAQLCIITTSKTIEKSHLPLHSKM